MKIAALLISCLLATTAAFAQANLIVLSNTNQPTPGDYAGVTPQQPVAMSFTTTSGTTNPFTVTVVLNGSYAYSMESPAVLGPFQLEIYSDAGGSPGSSLAVLSGTNYPNDPGAYSYCETNGLALAANTTYWILASTPGSSGQAGYRWTMTPTNGIESGSIWIKGVGEANNGGGGWIPLENLFFAITISVPAPTISISRPVMLTYPTPQAPFVLQQNSSLTGTNWDTVTNAISSSTTTNQTTIILPAGAGQMFYRLSPQ